MIKLDALNRAEAVRYMGGAGIELDENMNRMLDECEAQLLSCARPKYLYKIIDLPCDEIMRGRDIVSHLGGCDSAVLMCATLGADVDRLIRVTQVCDMARAVMLDGLASAAIEQVCRKVDEMLAQMMPDRYMTFRFSPGYGDYPIEMQKYFLHILDSPRKIGLSTNDNYLLIPAKSVTAVAGISDKPIERKKRGCAVCNLRDKCKFRKNGMHCGF